MVGVSWPIVGGKPDAGPFPPVPTRAQVCGMDVTFGGLTVITSQYGVLPWFDVALFSLTPSDRLNAYAAKRAARDTHAIIEFTDTENSLYDEPNQPYQQMRERGFQRYPAAFLDAVREVRRAGFIPEIRLGGDGPTGYPIALDNLEHLIPLLQGASPRDLTQDVLINPGWDSVFYGWAPDQIAAFGARFRELCPLGYLAIEFNPGHIPLGEGGDDYVAGGRMTTFDVLDDLANQRAAAGPGVRAAAR